MIKARPAAQRDYEPLLPLIRRAQARIARLGIDQWQDGYPEPELIQEDISLGRGWVFDDDGRVAAYAVLLPGREPVYDTLEGKWLTEGENYLTIHRMAIDDDWCGKGLSMQMIAFAEELARRQGLSSLRADTHRGNLAMRGLLNKCGFAYCGEVVYEVTAGDPVRVAYEKMV
ncbi:MAG: GNAT family N-acetyltransferase [Clostridia bacterium]|nr:GNAT family N-acetyltransferase [Clostridia bacterium]